MQQFQAAASDSEEDDEDDDRDDTTTASAKTDNKEEEDKQESPEVNDTEAVDPAVKLKRMQNVRVVDDRFVGWYHHWRLTNCL